MTTKVVDVDNYLFMRRFTATVASACTRIRPNAKRRERRQVTDMTEVKSTELSYARREATMTANGERRQGTSTPKPARSRRRISSASGTYVSSSAHDS